VSRYCREVESYLTRVNGGHLVRIVGAGFELVRGWAESGVPLSVVCRGIDQKAERHEASHSKHPLRIEFCEADVRTLFDQWRRAVGVPRGGDSAEESPHKAPALTKELDRAIDRLGRVLARTDLPSALLDEGSAVLQELGGLRDQAKGARGAAKERVAARLPAIDERLIAAARASVTPDARATIVGQAEADLAAYRDRLSGDAWQRAIDATVDRLLRGYFGLPTL